MRKLLYRDTRIGRFYICQSADGRFHPVFDDESLGSCHSVESAVKDIAGGNTFSVRGGADTSKLGIPRETLEWNSVEPID